MTTLPCAALAPEQTHVIERHFALPGFARYVKVLALVASDGDRGRMTMSWEAWAAALAAQPEPLTEFFNYCHAEGVLAIEDDGEQVEVSCPVLMAQAAHSTNAPAPVASPQLFTQAEQWAEWFIDDMAYPQKIAHQAGNMRLFRRWCASNVTVEEMNMAVNITIEAGTGLGTAALHGHLQALRAQRIKEANEW